MIRLFLEGDYCHECPAFKCECTDETIYIGKTAHAPQFHIQCANRDQCRLIHDFVLKNNKDEDICKKPGR